MPTLRIERRTTEKATLGRTLQPLDNEEGTVGSGSMEPEVGAFAISLLRATRNNRHSSRRARQDSVFERGRASSVDAVDGLQQEADNNAGPDAADCGQPQEGGAAMQFMLSGDKRKRYWPLMIFTLLIVPIVTVVVVVNVVRGRGSGNRDENYSAIDSSFHYISCSDIDPSPNSSYFENYDKLVAELGINDTSSSILLASEKCSPVDQALLFVSQDYDSWSETSRLSRFVLTTLFISTNGSYWFDQTGWMTSEPECSWFGISCDDDEQVKEIDVAFNRLKGPLPDELGRLNSIEALGMDGNLLSGAIPSTIQDLTSLRQLKLRLNQLVGAPLPWLVQMTWLKEIALSSNNYLSGMIPSEIGKMTALENFTIEFNGMNGTIPASLGDVSTLKILKLGSNDHSGTIPSSLGKLSKLQALELGYTNLIGSIPTEFGNLLSLTDLTMQNQELLTGAIPSELGLLTNLQKLDLFAVQQLSGTVPTSLEALTKLTELDLYETVVSGTLPAYLCVIIDVFTEIRGPCTLDCHYCCSQPQC